MLVLMNDQVNVIISKKKVSTFRPIPDHITCLPPPKKSEAIFLRERRAACRVPALSEVDHEVYVAAGLCLANRVSAARRHDELVAVAAGHSRLVLMQCAGVCAPVSARAAIMCGGRCRLL